MITSAKQALELFQNAQINSGGENGWTNEITAFKLVDFEAVPNVDSPSFIIVKVCETDDYIQWSYERRYVLIELWDSSQQTLSEFIIPLGLARIMAKQMLKHIP